jgi:hypothetical protein
MLPTPSGQELKLCEYAEIPPERPNNRLQGMRGLACFRGVKVLRDGPAPLTLVSLGR